MEKNKKVPKLRFPEFTGEWEEKKYCEIIIEGKLGGNYENSESNIGIPVIKMGNIGRGNIVLGKIQYLPENENYNNDDILKEGDLLFNTRNTLELVGKVSIWRCELPLALYNSNLLRMIFNDQIESSNRFMNYSFNSIKIIKQLRAFATGTTSVAAIYGKDLEHLKISFPSITEQTKIATFLTAVDEKLTQLKKKKKTLLEQYKKGIMQKLFSQELRFKDNNNQDFPYWQEKKIGEILTIGSGRDYKHLSEGNIPVFGTGGLMTKVNDFLYEGETVCIGRKGTIDKPMYYCGKIWTVDTLFYTHSFINVYPKFVYCIFLMINWKGYNEASGVPSLSKSTIEKIEINIPSLLEQQKIATFLSSIDEKISHSSAQIEKMETWKKGLLQQMFC